MSLRRAAVWPRSIRGRVTLLALGVAGLFLIPLAVAADTVIRHAVATSLARETREAASRAASAVRASTLRNPISPVPEGADLIQVIGPGGHVLAASDGADLDPISTTRPAGRRRVAQFTACPGAAARCYEVTAMVTGATPGAPLVYAAKRAPLLVSTPALEAAIGLQTAALAALVGWVAWKASDRGLRTIDNIKAELAHITVSDLSRRVAEPRGDTEIARLARTVNTTLARLENSVEQQRRFAADASHELRTPIAGLRAQLEEARLHPEHTDLAVLVDGALRDTDRLQNIITDLLFMARLGSGGPAAQERVDLARLAAEEAERRRGRVPVETDAREEVTVLGVSTHLSRVIGNLLDNAQRHADALVRVEVRARDGTAVLTVTNDGDRIPEADRERVFQRFARLDDSRSRDRGGTGLGLAIARDVAIAHGGTLHAEDVPEGTRFVLRLPTAG
ncbi:two-component sensor histidine kinase [Sphaerisporangium siamense]|uniref:histidine kinase n=1 Tax=Sphaerisporangium siamense TaxID=795645 RepID=A0A7W7DCZ4_9ACTN|nr:HAMP domain-containing sensor histidine kinase [Sphaerisporangium siamense]MBB4704326.1 signal transduction histidine kinase [Sphaerisporangium siamense]GII84992.1 two-component sensor histidine kinase [Sphaerisporangium siamense]